MSIEINKTGYDEWAAFYDDYVNPTVAIDDLVFPKTYLPIIDKDVLEIGCGTGRHTRRLVQDNNRVTAIDPSPGMLEKARQKTKGDFLKFIEGDFMTTNIPNGPFDVVVMSLVLEHIADLSSFFSKTRNLLKLGGIFYFSEIHPSRAAKGIMAHFKTAENKEFHLSSFPHTEQDISLAAKGNDFSIEESKTIIGTEELANKNAKWEKHLKQPLIQIWKLKAISTE